MATDHVSTPNTFLWGKKKKKKKAWNPWQLQFKQAHFTLKLKISYFNTSEREYKFQLKYGNLRCLTRTKRNTSDYVLDKSKGY